jgi:hypothetical protein
MSFSLITAILCKIDENLSNLFNMLMYMLLPMITLIIILYIFLECLFLFVIKAIFICS